MITSQAHKEMLVPKVTREIQDSRARMAQTVRKAPPVTMVPPVQRVTPVTLVPQVHRVRRSTMDSPT